MTFDNDLPFGDDEDGLELPPSSDRPALTCSEDGTHHFSQLKRLNLSGKQYIHACNSRNNPTKEMIVGTAIHQLVLGARPGKEVIQFDGKARKGKVWDLFSERHAGREILTAPEWARAEAIAKAVLADPVARARLDVSKREVPIAWEEDGLKFSTGGIDLLGGGALGDLKTTTTAEPEALKRQAFKMLYHCQIAFYMRGAKANGIDVSRGGYLLCVEVKPPFEVVDLELTAELLDLADRTVSLWIEKLRRYRDAGQWPGYAQSPIPWDVPAWMSGDDFDDDEEDA